MPSRGVKISLQYKDLEPFLGHYMYDPDDYVSGVLYGEYNSLFFLRDGSDELNEVILRSQAKALRLEDQARLRNLRMLRHVAVNRNLPEGPEANIAAFLAGTSQNRPTNANTRRIRLQRKIGMRDLPEHLGMMNASLFEGGRRKKSRRGRRKTRGRR